MFLTTRLWINYLYSFTFSFIYKKMVSYTCNIYLVSMCWICAYYLRFLRFSMLINIILIKKSVLDNKIMQAVSRGMLLFLDSQLCGRCFNLSKALQCFWISIPDILKKNENQVSTDPVNIYLFKVNNGNAPKRCEICSILLFRIHWKLSTILKTSKKCMK